MKLKSEKVGLKLNIQKTKIMASGPITSWQIDGKTETDFILGGSKIIAHGDCNHEIKRCLLPRRNFMTNLDSKEIKPVHPKGNQSWIFTDAEAETPILWPPDAKNWLIGKYPDAGKDWRLEEKGMTEDEMVGWHHQLNGHEFE